MLARDVLQVQGYNDCDSSLHPACLCHGGRHGRKRSFAFFLSRVWVCGRSRTSELNVLQLFLVYGEHFSRCLGS